MRTAAGTGTLVRLALRRDRLRLPLWVLAIVATTYASARAVRGLYPGEADLDVYARTVGGSAAAILMSGPPTALDTYGGVTAFEVNTVAVLATGLMAVLVLTRHTRGEEEPGRTELVLSGAAGRLAPLVAAVLVVSAACLLVGAGIAVALAAVGLPWSGSVLYGASIACVGLVLTAVTAVAAQLSRHGRAVTGASAGVLAAAFLVRGVGDVRGGALSWASPIGWAQATRPFGDERWWPLLLTVGLAGGLTVLAGVLVGHRDVGEAMLAARPGPASAGRGLSGSVGLAARLRRGAVTGWALGLLLLGLAYGALGREARSLVEGNPQLAEVFGASGGQQVEDAFLGVAVLTLAVLAAGFGVSSALRMRAEEAAGRLEPLLAVGLSRTRWALGDVAVTAAGSAVVLAGGGLGAGVAHAVVTDDASQVLRLATASLAYLPAILVLVALAVAAFGWAPRLAVAAWAGLALCFLVALLSDLLGLPAWAVNLSPFSHVPQAPAEELRAVPLALLTALAVGLGAAGVVGLRRRDVG